MRRLSLSLDGFAAKRFPPMASVWVKYMCWSSFVAPVCEVVVFFRNVGFVLLKWQIGSTLWMWDDLTQLFSMRFFQSWVVSNVWKNIPGTGPEDTFIRHVIDRIDLIQKLQTVGNCDDEETTIISIFPMPIVDNEIPTTYHHLKIYMARSSTGNWTGSGKCPFHISNVNTIPITPYYSLLSIDKESDVIFLIPPTTGKAKAESWE